MTASSRNLTFTARDGAEIAYSSSGSGDPLVVFVHATGFCKELADPVIEEVRAVVPEFTAVAIDQRAHGDSSVPEPPFDWWDVGRDIVDLVGDRRPVIGVGHSSGGAALLLAELDSPGLFAELVLVEPIVFPPPYGRFPDNPMSNGARRRKPGYPSRHAAYENFVSKDAFRGWQTRAMRAYVDGGLREADDGVVLKCTPEAEAEFFIAATEHRAWDRLREVAVPTTILAGEHSTTHQQPYLGDLTARLPGAVSEVVPATDHFVWMEKPESVARHVAEAVARQARPHS